MKTTEQIKTATSIPILIFIGCLMMFWVELVLQPGYFGKSIMKLCLFALLPLVYCNLKRPRISLSFCKIPQGKSLIHCLLWGGGVYAFIIIAYFLFAAFIDLPHIATLLQDNLAVNKENFIFVAGYIAMMNSFLEEFFFRGIAYFPLTSIWGKRRAALFSASAFSLYHVAILFGWFPLWMFLLVLAGLFIAGLFFLWLDERYQTILGSWLVHGCANLAINTIGLFMFGLL
ncbi:MAG: CPBP family intramembrane metalloprotease [Peptococcaceae bacterium]|nr:CPBP family intramembrane metalloprotease [Peptococcaceae bacterium]